MNDPPRDGEKGGRLWWQARRDRALRLKAWELRTRKIERTAYHEAGHALVAHTLPHADRVHKISIVSRGNMGGHTSLLPDEDRYLWTKNQFGDMLSVMMGGRVAEEMIFSEVTTGASNDIERATKVALSMVKRYGMSESLGPRTFGKVQEMVFLGREISEERDYGDKIAEEIDDEVRILIKLAYERAQEILVTNKPKLVLLSEYLIEHETISGDNMARLLDDGAIGDDPGTPAIPPDAPPETPPMTPSPAQPPIGQPSPALSSTSDPTPVSGDSDS